MHSFQQILVNGYQSEPSCFTSYTPHYPEAMASSLPLYLYTQT